MSVLRPSLSRRVGLALVAAALLLTGTLVAAPSVSGAPPARVKQFVASLSGGVGSSLTVTVTNCGGPTLPPECGAPSTIGLGAVQIAVPTGFQPASNVHASSGGTTWTNASYNPATKSVEVISPGGTNKLNPGQALVVTFDVPTTSFATCEGTNEFTTKAWGANAIAGSDPFEIKSSQPSLACSGTTVTGPNGQTETVSGFGGSVIVTFGGDLSCSFDPTFGSQWSQFNLPTQVNITPGPGFVAQDVIISTSRFPTEGNDSSLYLICYAVPTADHSTFVTRDGTDATTRTVNGVESYVGILPNCYDPIAGTTLVEPCVSEQFLDVTTNPDQIVISVRIPPADPGKR